MDVRDSITDAVRSVLADLGVDPLPTIVQLERPGNPEHGDWSTNVALASAKAAGRNPRELGTQLAECLLAAPPAHVVGVEVAGPGFVNFRLADSWLHEMLADVVAAAKKSDARMINVSGYTDLTGSDAYNSVLSEQRANAVINFLVESGVAKEKIAGQGLGEANPVVNVQAPEIRNRRVEIKMQP